MHLTSEKPIQHVINQLTYKTREAKEHIDSFKRMAHAKVNAKDLKNCAMGNLKPQEQKTQQMLYSAEYVAGASDKTLRQKAFITRNGEKVESSVGEIMSTRIKQLGEETRDRVVNSFYTFTDAMTHRANRIELFVDQDKAISRDKQIERKQTKSINLDWDME